MYSDSSLTSQSPMSGNMQKCRNKEPTLRVVQCTLQMLKVKIQRCGRNWKLYDFNKYYDNLCILKMFLNSSKQIKSLSSHNFVSTGLPQLLLMDMSSFKVENK